jgi:hypothetical protein
VSRIARLRALAREMGDGGTSPAVSQAAANTSCATAVPPLHPHARPVIEAEERVESGSRRMGTSVVVVVVMVGERSNLPQPVAADRGETSRGTRECKTFV